MAQLPTTLGDSLPIPVPQRTVNGYESQAVPNAMYQAGKQEQADAQEMEAKQNRDAVLDAQRRSNDAKAKVINLLYGDDKNPGLYAARGGQAMGAADKYSAQFTTIKSQALDGVTNIHAQKALTLDLENINLSNLDNVKRFEQDQRRGYTTDLTDAQNKLDSQRAGLEYNNQQTMDTLVANAEKTGITNAKLKGAVPGDLMWKQEVINAKSSVLSQQLDALSKSKDPTVLMQFNDKYEQYRQSGNLTLDAVDKFDKVRELIAPTVEAVRARQADNHDQMTYQVPDDKVREGIQAARVQAESGGKQFGGAGSVAGPNEPTTSPKGAIGAAQIMPSTGPEAAKLAGLPWDENKFRNDAGYNKTLGDAFYNEQKKNFGDTRVALVAYNAGPTITRDWMDGTNKSGKNDAKLRIGDPAKGQVTVDQFLAQVPYGESRKYVNDVLKNSGYSGSIGPMDMSMAEDKATRMSPAGAEAYLAMVKRDNAAYAAQIDQTRKKTMDVAFQYMADQGAGYHSMPIDLQSQIDAAGLTSQIKNYNPTAPSEQSTLMYLMGLPPKKLAETDLNTPDIRMSLSPVDYSRWKQKKEQMSTPAGQVTEGFTQTVLRDGFARRGVSIHTHYDTNTGEAVTEGGQDYIRAHDLLNTAIDAYSAQNGGRLPDGAAIKKMGDEIFTQIVVPGRWWGTNDVNKYDIKIQDIDADTKKQIMDALLTKGISPTEQNIIATYVRGAKAASND